MKIQRIAYPSPIEDSNPENDNADVHVFLDDGRTYSFLFATPSNIIWCMENEDTDHFFSFPPPVFVDRLTSDNVERTLRTMLSSDGNKWLDVYGALQTQGEPSRSNVRPLGAVDAADL